MARRHSQGNVSSWLTSDQRVIGRAMNDPSAGEPAYDPQQLEPMLVARQHAGDIDGMVALSEADAVIDCGDGRSLRSHEAIRDYYAEIVASGRKFAVGGQRPALICGDLALTSTRLADGDVTSEVARRQADGSWLWVIDRYSVAWD
ncbi:hypothetical protein [Mesorhizobium sp. WSM4311]|uniref:YybH family protein n=2 Tax=unclassified Mesorhizobium TaxID=325217 RepID=UPI001FE13E86|nr:hypothetical protein [Mesorhizobium sp. WSM4311]